MSFIKKLTQDQQEKLIVSNLNSAKKHLSYNSYYHPSQNIKLEDLFINFILNKKDKSNVSTFIKDQLVLSGILFKAKDFEIYELGNKGYGCSVIFNDKKLTSSHRFQNYKSVEKDSVIDLAANELLDDLLVQISKL